MSKTSGTKPIQMPKVVVGGEQWEEEEPRIQLLSSLHPHAQARACTCLQAEIEP